jgi:LDH2 family malate/lactate/ureidoglycolate dehydrogenase
MVEILCAVLTGAWSDGPGDDGAPTRTKHNVGHFFIAIDPAQVRSDGEFQDDMDRMIDMLHATPAVDPNTPVLVPGDPEVASRAERLENGIPVAETLIEETRRVAEESGAEFLFV